MIKLFILLKIIINFNKIINYFLTLHFFQKYSFLFSLINRENKKIWN